MGNTLFAIGEALIDFIPAQTDCAFEEVTAFSPKSGGAPANVCGAFTILGGSSKFITQLGDDPFGRKIAGDLARAGIDTSLVSFTDKANTALAFVSLENDGNKTCVLYIIERTARSCFIQTDVLIAVEPHGSPCHVITLIKKELDRNRAVNAAAHCHKNFISHCSSHNQEQTAYLRTELDRYPVFYSSQKQRLSLLPPQEQSSEALLVEDRQELQQLPCL